MTGPSVFERHPRATLACFWLAFFLLFAVVAEVALRKLTGMGHPVLFYSHPVYGYRMLPNQETWRFGGAHFKINTSACGAGRLGSRHAEQDPLPGRLGHLRRQSHFERAAILRGGGARSGRFPQRQRRHSKLGSGERLRPGRAGKIPAASVYVTTFIEDDFYRGLQSGRNKPWIKYEQPYFALQELAEFVWYKYFTDTQEINRREREGEPAEVRVARAAAKLKEMDAFLKARGYRHLIFISPTRPQVLGERRATRA